jgi:hypothetical protein
VEADEISKHQNTLVLRASAGKSLSNPGEEWTSLQGRIIQQPT